MRVFLSIIWMLLTVSWSFQNPKHDITKGVWHVIEIKDPSGVKNKNKFWAHAKIAFLDGTYCRLYRDSLVYNGTHQILNYSEKEGNIISFYFEGLNGTTLDTYQMHEMVKFVGDSLMFFIHYSDKGKQDGSIKFVRRRE